MDEELPVSRISRRKALKRIGAGAAIAWSAPVLSSVRTPAFATHRYDVCTGHELVDCVASTLCGSPTCPPPFDFCACVSTTGGGSACANQWTCDSIKAGCTSDAECGALVGGSVCVPASGNCCETAQCAPPCGTCILTAAEGTRGLPG